MRNTKALLALVALAAAASVAFASVFVYYPINVSVSPVSPPIVIDPGSNANQPDLAGNTITVNIGANKTSATVTVHPTYQTTYYKSIAVIRNTDTQAYNIWFKVKTALPGTTYSSAYLVIRDGTTNVTRVSLTSTGTTTTYYTLSAGGNWEVDLEFKINEGTTLPTTPDTATIQLIYSTGTETPP